MDMDTAEKRSSTLDWDQPFQPGIPVPSLSDTPGKRQHGMWMYSGIDSTPIIVQYSPLRFYPGAAQRIDMEPGAGQRIQSKAQTGQRIGYEADARPISQ